MMKNLKEVYLQTPCRTLSIPYWKNKTTEIPKGIVIIHCNDFENQFNNYQRFFRLIHNLDTIKNSTIKVDTINLATDKSILIDMINMCYKEQRISVDENDISQWINHPTYNEKLWIKVEADGVIIASGIAEYDKECMEGILEWVQVLPEYRSRGYGTIIVNSLLFELKNLGASFVTVSGDLDNNTQPEKLYRKCGFTGDDVWYICKEQ